MAVSSLMHIHIPLCVLSKTHLSLHKGNLTISTTYIRSVYIFSSNYIICFINKKDNRERSKEIDILKDKKIHKSIHVL